MRHVRLRLTLALVGALCALVGGFLVVPMTGHAATVNVFEDTFARPNQTGWGTSTNTQGVPNSPWSSQDAVTYAAIVNNTGQLSGSGGVARQDMAGIKSCAGDALVELRFNATGSATAWVGLCEHVYHSGHLGYFIRLNSHTSRLFLQKNGTTVGTPYTVKPSPNTSYWIRFDLVLSPSGTGQSATLKGRMWANGTAEPAAWQVSYTDPTFGYKTTSYVVLGAVWTAVQTSQDVAFQAFALAPQGQLAQPPH